MNEQLTGKGRSGHTNNMEDSGEKLVLTEVGKAFKEADSLAHGLESLGKEISKKSLENKQAELEAKKQQEAEKKKAEAKIREELAKTPKDAIVTPEEQEKELSKLVAPLSEKEQNAYKQILTGLPDTAHRASFLSSIRSLLKGQASAEQIADLGKEEVKKMKVKDVVGEASLEAFIQWKLSPKIEQVKKQIIDHVRDEGVDLKSIDSLSQEVESAIANEKYKLKEKAKKGEWDKVRAQLTQIMSDVENREKRLQEEHSEPSEADTEQKITEQGELEKELREAEVKTQVKVAADRFRKGEEEIAPSAEAASDLDNKTAESLDSIELMQTGQSGISEQETPDLAEPESADNKKNPSDESSQDETAEDLNRLTEPKGKLNIDPEVVYANADIPDTEEGFKQRLENAKAAFGEMYEELSRDPEHVLLEGMDESQKADFLKRMQTIVEEGLSQEQRDAIIAAHLNGASNIYELSLGEVLSKSRILKKGKDYEKESKEELPKDDLFINPQIRILMEYGITGGIAQTTDPRLDEILKTAPYLTNGESPYIDHSSKEKIGRKTYERYGGDDDFYHPASLESAAAEILKANMGKSVLDDVTYWEDTHQYESEDSPSTFLSTKLSDDETFSMRGVNRSIFKEMERLSVLSDRMPGDVRNSLDSTVRTLGAGLESLRNIEQRSKALQEEISQLRDQYWMTDGSQEVRAKIREAEQQAKMLEVQYRNAARPLLNSLDTAITGARQLGGVVGAEGMGDEDVIGEHGPVVPGGPVDGDDGGGGDRNQPPGRGNNGERGREGGDAPPPPESRLRLRGRGEGEDAEEDPLGRSVRSIEDLGHFMEKVTAEYDGKIMAALYRGRKRGSMIGENELEDGNNSEKKKEDLRLYAFKVGQGEYARDYDNVSVDEGEEGRNKVLMLTKDEIINNGYIGEREIRTIFRIPENRELPDIDFNDAETRAKIKDWIGSRPRGQSAKDYWEAVKVVRPDQFMSWIRSYWTLIHSDDPDNPLNFFTEIVVNHPDQRGGVQAARMHKDHGTFLRSRFLTDPTTGELRVFDQLRNQIINEVWVPGGERNKEVLYKKIMHSDEELPKQVASQITGDNLMAKTAAGGKNTMEMFFTLPEHFTDDFDWVTGKTLSDEEKMIRQDVRFGSSILLAYEMYYNIGDIEGLKKLLGENASFFTRDAITRATLEISGMYMPENLADLVHRADGSEENFNYYALADKLLTVTNKTKEGTVINEDLYHQDGKVKSDTETLTKWLTFMNPYYPVQKDATMLSVIRKVVENQVQELTGIPKSSSGSQLAELHAYLRTYHDGVAARHDFRMGNRNSQTKYEFLGAPGGYQDKQGPRDRAGNLYNKGLVWRSTVGVLHAMPTRNGETVQDVLANATKIHINAIRPYNELIRKARTGQLPEYNLEEINAQIKAGTLESQNSKIQDLLAQFKKVNEVVEEKLSDRESERRKKSQQRYDLMQQIQELYLQEKPGAIKDAWDTYKENEQQTLSEFNNALGRLNFDEVQYSQYGGMHYSNSTGVFHMEMNSTDLPLDKIRGRDYLGKSFFKTEEFGPWLEESEKKMRYTIETWPLPLGSTERRLINPRGSGVPKYVELPIIETVFGSYDYTGARNGGVMGMAQKMVNRQLAKENKPEFWFTDGKGNVVETRANHDKLDRLGNPEIIPDWDGEWENSETLKRRENLRRLVGYIEYDPETGKEMGYKGGDVMNAEAASIFTRAYVKVRISNFILSHTDKYSPYEKWTVEQREDFFKSLRLANYFSQEDIDDIREFANNGYWRNFGREVGKSMWKDGGMGFLSALKYFFSNSVKS